jgi:pSer/pThr/pTyr-binding forkhead associated (FHA) protein
MLAIENAEHCPVGLEDVEHPPVPKSTRQDITDMDTGPADGKVRNGPLLFLTRNGETLRKIRFDGSRLLIGRTEHNDLHIESKYVSRHHAMLVRHGNSTLLMDQTRQFNTPDGPEQRERHVCKFAPDFQPGNGE